jgi:iron complex outermembrane receptor protein
MKYSFPCLIVFIIIAGSLPCQSQNTILVGNVIKYGSSQSLSNVIVQLFEAKDSVFVAGVYTDINGDFQMDNISSGNYYLELSCVGYRDRLESLELLVAGERRELILTMEEELLTAGTIVTTASRIDEKLLKAPASLTIVNLKTEEPRNTLTPVDYVIGVSGIDMVEKGMMQKDYVARGLNDVFTGKMRTFTDNRIAGLPALRANVAYLMPQITEDIDRIEVVLGPGSALYGPNVTNGILHIITKSPFASRGTNVSITAGENNLLQATFRNAGVLGKQLGYKISGQYLKAEDWPYPFKTPDEKIERFNSEFRLDYLFGKSGSINLTAGISQAIKNIELTDNGPVQARNFRYSYLQGRLAIGDFFIQAYINENDAGNTFLIEEMDTLVDNSKKIVAEIQYRSRISTIQRFTYGVDMFLTRPESEGTIFGRNESKTDINEFGGYLQSETQLIPALLDLILAARIDWHSALTDPVFSPRAGIVFSPQSGQTIRLTYNRAYSTPVSSDLFLDLLVTDDIYGFEDFDLGEYAYGLRGIGVPETGLNFERDPNLGLSFYSTVLPNQSIPVIAGSTLWMDWVVPVIISGADPSQQPILDQLFASIPAPTPEQVGTDMRQPDLETGTLNLIKDEQVKDIPALLPTINQTLELGYKGVLADHIQFGIDVYYSQIKDFITTQHLFTPNTFLNEEDIYNYILPYIINAGLSPEEATALADLLSGEMANIPLGTVTPKEAWDPTELLLAPTNAGDIEYWGIDFALNYVINRNISLFGNYSYLSENYFEDLAGFGDLSLNAPQHKGSLGLRFSTLTIGLSGELRYRYVDGYRVKSAIYLGYVKPYNLIDLAITYPFSFAEGLSLTVSAKNILNYKHQEFVHAAEIGRLVTARLAYSF